MNHEELKIVTDDTLKELRGFDVITPNLYSDAFGTKLKGIGSLEGNSVLESNEIPLIMDKVLKIQKETLEGTKTLKENIDLATVAIDNEDTKTLSVIKEHMLALQERISALEEAVYIDDLTKAHNRKWLFDKVLRTDETFAKEGVLTFIDLDDFKTINDTYGHIAGDKVLFLIANMLQKLEAVDVVRYGGDEFIMISFSKTQNQLEEYITKINEGFKNKSFKFQGNTFKVSLSSGSSHFKEGENFHQITAVVDEKMYETKRAKKEKLALTA